MRRQGRVARSDAPVATDRSAPARCAKLPAARQRRRPDARNSGGEVSRVMLHELEHPCPPTIISKSSLNVCFWHKADIAIALNHVRFRQLPTLLFTPCSLHGSRDAT